MSSVDMAARRLKSCRNTISLLYYASLVRDAI
jgi:hypothetical protein